MEYGKLSYTEKENLEFQGAEIQEEKPKTKREVLKEKRKLKKAKFKAEQKRINTNVHHQIAKIMGGSEYAENKRRTDIKEHQADHVLFGVKLIHDKLIQIIDDNISVLCKDTRDMFREELIAILNYYLQGGEFYNEKCFKSRDRIPREVKA